jgi:hypothetical protein
MPPAMTKPVKISAQKAIYNHCKGCIYDPKAGGTWVEQIEACTITQCELYEHRKLTAKTRRLQREKELALLTPAEREIIEKRAENSRQNMLDLHSQGILKP